MNAPKLDRSPDADSTWLGWLDIFAAMPSPIAAVAYLSWLTGATTAEIFGMLIVFLGAALVAVGMTARPKRSAESLMSEGNLGEPGARSRRAEFEALHSLPVRRQQVFFFAGFVPVFVLPLLLGLVGDVGWFELPRLRSLVLVSVVAAALASTAMFYWTRRSLASARTAFRTGPEGVGSAEFAKLGLLEGGTAFSTRLQVAVAIPAIAGLLLVVDVTSSALRADAESHALAWAESVVDFVAHEDSARPLRERVELALPSEKLWPVATEMFETQPDGTTGPLLDLSSDAFLSELDRQIFGDASAGRIAPRFGPEIGAFRKLEGGAVLIARIVRRDLPQPAGMLGWGVLGVVLVMGVVSILFGVLVSREVARSVEGLQCQAKRLATGDLRVGPFEVSNDEFGELAQALAAVGSGFRAALDRTSQAAARVDQTVASLTNALAGITGASTNQARQVEQAGRLMGAIQGQVVEASLSADQLNHAMDESSNSVVELGAAGDELRETASVLTSKVDAVSDSLEQMVASVDQVSATTDRLAAASEETSSSMEEMASAMRAVDTAAETTARLSRDVVAKAELGQEKVVQTIAGMDAIREATDVAERVIRGLGARTNEIGGILDVIEDVADETNLLALNAAIIAAQAGDQGRAFSVVADEIKQLADRVLASTKEIGGLIRAVQEESENAIGAIEVGSASVMSGVDLSAEAGRTLEEITVASRESGTRISEIVNSVREQTKAASHVVRLMERVRESADQIGAAGAEQGRGNEVVYRSARTMREVAEQVRRTAEDQATGFGRIRENVVGVRGAVEQMTGVLQLQADACKRVTGFLDGVAAESRSNEKAAENVRSSIADLAAQAEELREDVERFRC